MTLLDAFFLKLLFLLLSRNKQFEEIYYFLTRADTAQVFPLNRDSCSNVHRKRQLQYTQRSQLMPFWDKSESISYLSYKIQIDHVILLTPKARRLMHSMTNWYRMLHSSLVKFARFWRATACPG